MIVLQSAFAQTEMGNATVSVAAFGVSPNASVLNLLVRIPSAALSIAVSLQLSNPQLRHCLRIQIWKAIFPSLSKVVVSFSQGYPRWFRNVFQGYPNLPKAIQGNFRKKRLFISCRGSVGWEQAHQPKLTSNTGPVTAFTGRK
jgi:hypothetical protein